MHVTTGATWHILTVSFTLSPTTRKRRKRQASCTTSNVYGNLSKNSFFSALRSVILESGCKGMLLFSSVQDFQEKSFQKTAIYTQNWHMSSYRHQKKDRTYRLAALSKLLPSLSVHHHTHAAEVTWYLQSWAVERFPLNIRICNSI